MGGKAFTIRAYDSGRIVYQGNLSDIRHSEFSNKKTSVLSFTEFSQPGIYLIDVPGLGRSLPFEIRDGLLSDLANASLKAFYYQRASTPIEELYAGKWARPSGHPDDHILVHSSAASSLRPEGTVISSPKGWYDAGDYNKYMVNSGFTLGVLLSLYEDYPDYMKPIRTQIPESTNQTPDLLDEIYWNLEWMLTMQDPADGGVYHKLTNPEFEGFIKPTDCKKQRYVVAKSVTAALDFAASMAQAARIYGEYAEDYPGVAEITLTASKRAFDWALKNPQQLYQQRKMNETHAPAISTGEYGDGNAEDEFFWAATELYIATANPTYLQTAIAYAPQAYTLPVWGNVYGLGAFSLIRYQGSLPEQGQELANRMKEQLLMYADSALLQADQSPYAVPYGRTANDFFWGCNSDAASNQGMTFLYAYQLTGKKEYLTAALHNMDYLLGRNATGYCYITGFGTKSPLYPHHRLSASDDIEEPIPGFLVGGPNAGRQDGCEYPSDIPDECYADVLASYASNEVAINWQGLFTYFIFALNASLNG